MYRKLDTSSGPKLVHQKKYDDNHHPQLWSFGNKLYHTQRQLSLLALFGTVYLQALYSFRHALITLEKVFVSLISSMHSTALTISHTLGSIFWQSANTTVSGAGPHRMTLSFGAFRGSGRSEEVIYEINDVVWFWLLLISSIRLLPSQRINVRPVEAEELRNIFGS